MGLNAWHVMERDVLVPATADASATLLPLPSTRPLLHQALA